MYNYVTIKTKTRSEAKEEFTNSARLQREQILVFVELNLKTGRREGFNVYITHTRLLFMVADMLIILNNIKFIKNISVL